MPTVASGTTRSYVLPRSLALAGAHWRLPVVSFWPMIPAVARQAAAVSALDILVLETCADHVKPPDADGNDVTAWLGVAALALYQQKRQQPPTKQLDATQVVPALELAFPSLHWSPHTMTLCAKLLIAAGF